MELQLDVRKTFGAFHLDARCMVKGERIGVFGPSGSGKSTMTGMLAGVLRPDDGYISVDGDVLFDSSTGRNVPMEQRRIGQVFQHANLFPHLSVRANLLYGYKRCVQTNRKISLGDVTHVLRIEHLLGRNIRHLSGGEMQRVAIGRAVLSNPRLLIMDEPLSGLDDTLKFQIIPFLKEVCQTFSIPCLFISHSMLEMMIMTEKVLCVEEGRVSQLVGARELARNRMGIGANAYLNIIEPRYLHDEKGLSVYEWGALRLYISRSEGAPGTIFELLSNEIVLFKRHPEAISARNLLECLVIDIFESGKRLGVELECKGKRLIAEIVRQAADDLEITRGSVIYAAIKASAFRRLG